VLSAQDKGPESLKEEVPVLAAQDKGPESLEGEVPVLSAQDKGLGACVELVIEAEGKTRGRIPETDLEAFPEEEEDLKENCV
jgi:hypothetical protein